MTVFSVFTGADGPDPGDTPIDIVGDRFSWGAFLALPVWLAWHRLWVELAVVAVAAVALAFTLGRVNPDLAVSLGMLVALLAGFEASSIRERALKRRGYVRRADIAAASPADAELRWLMRVTQGENRGAAA
ncbi:MAG TPA: DUF2628 domain-containing protein [Devosiaceae bacterium]|nr:DUF2628 domain-containing protein [Devosiaceae bacterium]